MTTIICDAAIRPFPNELEVRCEIDSNVEHRNHKAVLRDYAYQGSETTIEWFESDRRNYHGKFPGYCRDSCTLPLGHAGSHAL